ncbi:hypothetical protein ALC62_02626 [Cyphomyrmex costatus]|uniref:Uncharacterized protein n=1 Tax=Cyphomyrmex costatus TaxID=456900 RepID=A0A195D107_9HYME|nr:hypothetical protein ALC62_02626 [Cyphomyrmex costatus]
MRGLQWAVVVADEAVRRRTFLSYEISAQRHCNDIDVVVKSYRIGLLGSCYLSTSKAEVRSGLQEKVRLALLVKQELKRELLALEPPKLNREIISTFSKRQSVVKRDEYQAKAQIQVGACLNALGTSISDLLKVNRKFSLQEREAFSKLADDDKTSGGKRDVQLLTQDAWMMTLDLEDAYLLVPIAHEYRRFLRPMASDVFCKKVEQEKFKALTRANQNFNSKMIILPDSAMTSSGSLECSPTHIRVMAYFAFLRNHAIHSTRHVATSLADKKGISLDLIKRAAGWSGSSRTFARFDNRPIVIPENVTNMILGS